jgi:hypothetical protein
VSTAFRDTTANDAESIGISERGSRATPSNVQNLTANAEPAPLDVPRCLGCGQPRSWFRPCQPCDRAYAFAAIPDHDFDSFDALPARRAA